MTLDLKDFIVSAITQISEGVLEADDIIKEHGGLVNPGTHTKEDNEFIAPRTTLDFDIAVSASSSKGAEGKISVLSASIGGGKTLASETASRLTFSLDVVLPTDENQKERVGKIRKPV